MQGLWKDTTKNYLKDKLKWYVQNDKIEYVRNYSNTYSNKLELDERLISNTTKEYEKFIVEVLADDTIYKFIAYYEGKVFNYNNICKYKLRFSKDNTNLNLNIRNKWDNELAYVEEIFHWRNWECDPVYISIKPIYELETVFITKYFIEGHPYGNLPSWLNYKGFLKGIKLDFQQIYRNTKKDIHDLEYEKIFVSNSFKTKTSSYTDKELREFKQTSNRFTQNEELWGIEEDKYLDWCKNDDREDWENYMYTETSTNKFLKKTFETRNWHKL